MSLPPNTIWRKRALHYSVIYLVLACVMVGTRYATRSIYPDLKDLRATRAELTHEKQAALLKIDETTSTASVRAWAHANGMVPFSRAKKEQVSLTAAPAKTPTVGSATLPDAAPEPLTPDAPLPD
ncbi:hypothetical protein [Deinococcus soli (ex Cha et al. 2016)]|uniref:Uncharacterized protein n=2 Tax=Deinococcus soli (ex Cha et al. 2016) TaxID=1309411 RepID=A0ACC6KH50_9DEIO|nr:hypothetical protein [Deinococcus soli (ex Cha et al. 2016)]MDR6218886.1 hypothetical protein [Deinococcus soli (ex Cha et al. 2016)]MDR6328683.1 hypothetical protein [Deinococcus soli (ex Cha et al. 2016)]MDR6751830.1 hypothetical protein [Deinococcus soli (ex Cha et al. 2016)]